VARWYAQSAKESLARAGFEPVLVTIPAGERSKNMRQVEACYNSLAQHRLERGSFVVALGGGVVGDLAGFVAATYLRGLAYLQVPTSLLAQVDSSVGGKTGVNLRSGKNLVGSFYQPRLVLCDLDTLETLPARELRSGLAEVIKYGVIYDRRLFVRLERQLPELLALNSSRMASVVARCCEIKADVVRQDEKEGGLRAILNFGHTIGHAIENSVGYGKYLHGEAIAIGQVAAAWLSVLMLGLSRGEVRRIAHLLEQAGLPTSIRLGTRRREKLLAAMKLDKKVQGGEIRFVLAEQIGRVRFGQRVPAAQIDEALDRVQELSLSHSTS
jgi:3-dehydroquinate synthase